MTPRLLRDDPTSGAEREPVQLRQRFLGLSKRMGSPHVENLGLCQFRILFLRTLARSPFQSRISRIICLGAQKEVIGAYTKPIAYVSRRIVLVAIMAYRQAVRNRPVVKLPGYAVCQEKCSAIKPALHDCAITMHTASAGPKPAAIRFLDATPKAHDKRLALMAVGAGTTTKDRAAELEAIGATAKGRAAMKANGGHGRMRVHRKGSPFLVSCRGLFQQRRGFLAPIIPGDLSYEKT